MKNAIRPRNSPVEKGNRGIAGCKECVIKSDPQRSKTQKALSQLNASELKYETAAELVEQTLSSFLKSERDMILVAAAEGQIVG